MIKGRNKMNQQNLNINKKLYNFSKKMHTRLCHKTICRAQDCRMLIIILTSVVWKICHNGKYQTNTENELMMFNKLLLLAFKKIQGVTNHSPLSYVSHGHQSDNSKHSTLHEPYRRGTPPQYVNISSNADINFQQYFGRQYSVQQLNVIDENNLFIQQTKLT